MDPTQITPVVVGVLAALVPAAVGYLRGSNRKARARAALAEVERDERDERLMEHRREIRLHNDRYHPTGEGALVLPPLPPHLNPDLLKDLIDDADT